jgi:hypothetical protein
MTYRVEINDCLDQFHRAHEALIESLGGSHHIVLGRGQGINHWDLMEHNWKLKYFACPVGENGRWKYLDFESEQHYTMFILRWS